MNFGGILSGFLGLLIEFLPPIHLINVKVHKILLILALPVNPLLDNFKDDPSDFLNSLLELPVTFSEVDHPSFFAEQHNHEQVESGSRAVEVEGGEIGESER